MVLPPLRDIFATGGANRNLLDSGLVEERNPADRGLSECGDQRPVRKC